MNAIVPAAGHNANVLMPTNMDSAIRLADMMARGKIGIPEHLRNNPGDCLLIVEQAMRWGMSPFAVAACTSVISGKLNFEGKIVAAALNGSGIMAARLEYEYSGTGPDLAVMVRGTIKGEAKPREIKLWLREAKTTNGMWVKQPEQQLCYAGTRVWARRHAPEVMLGVYSPEEFDAQTARDTFRGTTLDADPPTPDPVHVMQPPPVATAQPKAAKPTVTQWLDALALELAACEGSEEVDEVLARADIQAAQDKLRNGARDRLTDMIQTAIARTSGDETSAPVEDDGLYADPAADPFREMAPT
jgi:hypothetical protein